MYNHISANLIESSDHDEIRDELDSHFQYCLNHSRFLKNLSELEGTVQVGVHLPNAK